MSDEIVNPLTVATDYADYAPGDTAVFTASNVAVGATIEFSVAHVEAGADGIYGTVDDLYTHDLSGTTTPWSVTDGGTDDSDGLVNGIVVTSWFVNFDDVGEFLLTATNTATGETATASFDPPPPPPVVPGGIVNLTASGNFGTVGVGIFDAAQVGAGAGVFPAFVQIQKNGSEQGYNYDKAGGVTPEFDEKTDAPHNHTILLSDVPVRTGDGTHGTTLGVLYREFLLDSNEGNGQNDEFLSLDRLQIFQDAFGNLTTLGIATTQASGTTTAGIGFGSGGSYLAYNLDAGSDTWVALNSTLSSGSGNSDIRVLIPDSFFMHDAAHQFVYIYSAFGLQGGDWSTGATQEEWGFGLKTGGGPNEPATISGSKLEDADGNLATTGDQTFLSGWTIYIDADGSNTLNAGDTSTVTDINGNYTFGNLTAGTYTIREVLQAGWTQLAPSAPDEYTITVPSGGVASGFNFYNFKNISISGLKYTDENGNGSLSGDTPGTPGQTFTIELYKWTDSANPGVVDPGELSAVLATTETDATTGAWAFNNLGPLAAGEKYYVKEAGETGWTQTFGNAGYGIIPTSGDDSTTNNFGNFKNISISGLKYTDENGNGSLSGDTPGTPGQTFTIELYKWTDSANPGVVDPGELSAVLATTETDATTGAWAFNNLGPLAAGEKYYVKEAGETGWTQTFGNAGYGIIPTSGDDSTTNNFGNFKNISISGLKYTDENGNGSLSGDTPGTPGQTFTIELYKWTDSANPGVVDPGELSAVLATTETDATTGAWAFNNLGPLAAGEKYYVKEAGETGWTQTFGNAGYGIIPTSGDDSTTNNFGNFKNISISGLKYTDENGNGSLSGDTPGTPGQTFTIELYKWTDSANPGVVDPGELSAVLATTETDATTGAWAFNNLGPLAAGEKYYVKEAGETGWTQTFGNAGYGIIPTSGDDSTTNNFGNFKNISISGLKYTDENGNGSLSGDTPGTPGQTFTIELYKWTDTALNPGVVDPGELSAVLATTETDATTGAWAFNNLGPLAAGEKYYVKEAGETGWTQTFGNAGYAIAATSGDDSTTNDFGNFKNFDISGTKYDDKTANGITLVDDTPLGGVRIFVDMDGDGQYDNGEPTALTANDGTWSITNLGPSAINKNVLEVAPNGYVQTVGDYLLNNTSGQDSTGLDFANFKPLPHFVLTKEVLEVENHAGNVGDVIHYQITVHNDGNIDLTNVDVIDTIENHTGVHLGPPTSGDGPDLGVLDIGETWTWLYDYTVTQADLDNNSKLHWQDGGISATLGGLPVGEVNNALFFSGTDLPATGSGLVNSFVRIQNSPTEQGYNTDYRPYDAANNAGNTDTFNHSIQLAEIPVIKIDSVQYREFHLDTNEPNSGTNPLLSLDALKLFASDVDDLHGFDGNMTFSSHSSSLLYNLDGGGDVTVLLNDWSTGSGHGDYVVDIPEEFFASLDDDAYIYLYSAFGASNPVDGGFEEWYVIAPETLHNDATVTAHWLADYGYNTLSGNVSGSDSADVTLQNGADFHVDKVADKNIVNNPGEVITYTVTVDNTGNSALTGIIAKDVFEGGAAVTLTNANSATNTFAGDTNGNGKLDVTETWAYTYTHTVTQAEFDSKAGGDGLLTNVVTVDSNETHPHSDQVDVDPPVAVAVANHFNGAPFSAHAVAWWNTAFTAASGSVLLGDANHDGSANDAYDLLISNAAADAILNSNSSSDPRVMMLAQAIAAQLNSNAGVALPSSLTDEAIQWLTNKGTWSGLSVDVDGNHDNVLDSGKISGGTFGFNGAALKTSAPAWTKFVDVVNGNQGWEWDNNSKTAGNQEADGEGLKNALMYFNQNQLVTSSDGADVGWSSNGNPGNVVDVHANTLDQFWLTLHQVGGLGGIG